MADLHGTPREGAVDAGHPGRVVAGRRAEVAEAGPLRRPGELGHQAEHRAGTPVVGAAAAGGESHARGDDRGCGGGHAPKLGEPPPAGRAGGLWTTPARDRPARPTVCRMSAADGPAHTAPVVPGYTLEARLGRGGSGEVWRAVPRRGGAPVAVKVLVAGDPERQAREAALLGELDHPHLVRLLEVVHQPQRGGAPRVALVLELLAGGSLAALLARRGRLRPGEVVTAIAPVAAALAHAHGNGVVHGDLSPGNIVFTAEGRPVLTDLGVARVLGETAAAEVTPAYVDPTVARGGAPGPASDVFGVAAAAFHALTGIAPWNAATPGDTLSVAAVGLLPDLAELAPEAPRALIDGHRPRARRRPPRPGLGGGVRARPPARLPSRAGAAARGRGAGRRAGAHRPRSTDRADPPGAGPAPAPGPGRRRTRRPPRTMARRPPGSPADRPPRRRRRAGRRRGDAGRVGGRAVGRCGRRRPHRRRGVGGSAECSARGARLSRRLARCRGGALRAAGRGVRDGVARVARGGLRARERTAHGRRRPRADAGGCGGGAAGLRRRWCSR